MPAPARADPTGGDAGSEHLITQTTHMIMNHIACAMYMCSGSMHGRFHTMQCVPSHLAATILPASLVHVLSLVLDLEHLA